VIYTVDLIEKGHQEERQFLLNWQFARLDSRVYDHDDHGMWGRTVKKLRFSDKPPCSWMADVAVDTAGDLSTEEMERRSKWRRLVIEEVNKGIRLKHLLNREFDSVALLDAIKRYTDAYLSIHGGNYITRMGENVGKLNDFQCAARDDGSCHLMNRAEYIPAEYRALIPASVIAEAVSKCEKVRPPSRNVNAIGQTITGLCFAVVGLTTLASFVVACFFWPLFLVTGLLLWLWKVLGDYLEILGETEQTLPRETLPSLDAYK